MSQTPQEKAAADSFRKGTEAMNHKNWDYAIECFLTCSKLVPDNVLYRQSRHGCIRKSYNDNGSGAKMAGMRLMGVKSRIKTGRLKKDWKSVEVAAEDGLMVNPWDAQLYFDLGEAAEHLDNGPVARYALERAVELDRNNVDYNRKLGAVLFERGDYKPARACFERIYKLVPTDGESRTMMSKCDAMQVLDTKNVQNAQSTRDVKVEQPAAPVNAYEEDRKARKGQPKAADAPGESAEADLVHAIRKDPQNVGLYLKLSDVYKAAREFGKAQDQLNKALELSPNAVDIKELILEIQLMMLREDASEAAVRARSNPGKERLVEKANALRQDVINKEIEFFTLGVENNPTDLKRKFELGSRLASRSVKQYGKAIPLLQQASSNPNLKVDSLVLLGECFAAEGKIDLARRQFEKALEGLSFSDRPDAFKSANYFLGRIYQKGSNKEKAEFHYGEVLAVDYEYKDTLKRLEEMGEGSSAGIDG